MPRPCCQTSQSHCPEACGPIKKFYDDYNVVFMSQKIMQYSYMYAHRKIDTSGISSGIPYMIFRNYCCEGAYADKNIAKIEGKNLNFKFCIFCLSSRKCAFCKLVRSYGA